MKPFKHQIDAVYFAMLRNGNAFLKHDMGIGKTRSELMLFQRLREIHPDLKLFVLCPKKLIKDAWIEDIQKFTSYKFDNLADTRSTDVIDIGLMNYETFRIEKNNAYLAKLLDGKKWMCVLDESSILKDHKSKTAKKLLKIASVFKYRGAMSATPAPNKESEWWAQIKFVNPDIFPGNFYAFESKYMCFVRGESMQTGSFFAKKDRQKLLSSGWKQILNPDKKAEFYKKLSQVVHYANKKECLDLPHTIDVVRRFDLSHEEKSAYTAMEKDLVLFLNEYAVTAELAIKKVMKLRQITSGFILGDQQQIHQFKDTSKKEMLIEVLDEIGNKQVIIWVNFRHEVEMLKDLPNHVVVGGGVDSDKAIEDFKAGRVQYLLINTQSGAHGLTFINCHYQIFYSLNYSFELYSQARGRTDRAGQTESTTYIHLIANNSIDEDVLNVVQRKSNLEAIVNKYLRSGRQQSHTPDAQPLLPELVGAQAK